MYTKFISRLEQQASAMSVRDIVLFAVLVALIKIMFGSYHFGLGDHTGQLPSIFRILDNSFLSNDFFVNASEAFGPTYYFSHLMAMLGRVVPLPLLFVSMTFLVNMAIALVTFFTTLEIFKGSKITALLTSVLVLTVEPFSIGGGGWLVYSYLKPSFLARPMAYIALWAALKQRPIISIGFACLSSLIHPTLGLETGLFALIIVAFGYLEGLRRDKVFRRTLIAAAILGGFGFIFWIIPQKIILDTKLFLQILLFRAESSLIPSGFSLKGYLGAAVFLFVFMVAWRWWRRQPSTDKKIAGMLLVSTICVLLFCLIVGYVFVEIFPTRLAATLWSFRMLYLVKWFGLIIIAGTIVKFTNEKGQNYRLPERLMYVGIAMVILLVARLTGLVQLVTLALCLITILWFLLVRNAMVRRLIPLCVAFLVIVDSYYPLPLPNPLRRYGPDIQQSSSILKYGGLGVAEYARQNTPGDAIFLTPPGFGGFRMSAERAIVVDWKAIPFHDEGLLGWWRRINDCYGNFPELSPREGKKQMFAAYRHISTGRINAVAEKYGVTFAVLHQETPCSFPMLYKDDYFKLVRIID